MECNKDEAVRARDIAEKKMENNDFEGARKMAKKAQSIYPGLENLMQLITICDVLCSSQGKVLGSDKDWYEILQVDRFADQLTIKKQYRRLALFLHPDKNRFPGAEAAFKLICEANTVLSDPAKKSLFDNKIRFSSNINKSSQFMNKPGFQNKGYSNLNQHRPPQSSSSTRPDAFWTTCPLCRVRYLYHRQFVNRLMFCQRCSDYFMAYEDFAEGVPLESKQGTYGAQPIPSKLDFVKPAASQVNENQPDFKMGVKNEKGFSSRFTGTHGDSHRKPVQQAPGIQKGLSGAAGTESAAKSNRDLENKRGLCSDNLSNGHKEDKKSNADTSTRELDMKNVKKRVRKVAAESSESLDDLSGSDARNTAAGRDCGDTATKMDSGPVCDHFPRRSSRERKHAIYNETDDDLTSGLLASHERKLPKYSIDEEKDAFDEAFKHGLQNSFPADEYSSKLKSKHMGIFHPVGNSLHKGSNHGDDVRARGETGKMPGTGANTVEIESDSDKDLHSTDNSDGGLYEVPDPEFGDFDKDRDESRFSVDQIWACYDPVDGMPRFYAKVKKIIKSPFGLRFTWLEADPKEDSNKKWVDEGLPVGCGRFKLGKTEGTTSLLSFSHQIGCQKGQKRGSLMIYPREGETWAIFKDWSMSWKSLPINHEFKYEIVEVLSNFAAGSGIRVCQLDKIEKFVSIFRRTSLSNSFLIGPTELYRFSHRVPCYKVTGHETRGVPEGSFELDPASLPLNPANLYYPGKASAKQGHLDHGVNGSLGNQINKVGRTVIPEDKGTAKKVC